MDADFWLERWRTGATGFHNKKAHPLLAARVDLLLQDDEPTSVLVPLCGKSVDMLLLRNRTTEVTGVEFSQLACDAFFAYQHMHNSFYDRATLIALPEVMQVGYVAHLMRTLTSTAKNLVITLENSAIDKGPPFCVTHNALFS